MNSLFTDKVDKTLPLPEYPRPQLVRDNWLNLNGKWNYAFTESAHRPNKYDGEILVPFSPECELSGVCRTLKPGEYLWYERFFTIPESFKGKHVILHFGAVDCEAWVYVNGQLATHHIGGYLPFSSDISSLIGLDRNEIVVKVRDDSDTSFHSRGKQSSRRGGIWYSPQSGIWQTVWIEAVPDKHIGSLRITPSFADGSVTICADVDDAVAVFEGELFHLPATIKVNNFVPWSPENPKLYYFSVICGEDKVDSYFAIRDLSVGVDEYGTKRLFLNGKPYFNNGLLDQGYWPDGLYTAPTDEAMVYDITLAKQMGFNCLRKHIKIEPLRWYYHCDRLGIIVWQDMVNGGGKYNQLLVTAPLVTNIHIRDSHYSLFSRRDADGRNEYYSELKETIDLLYSCPSVCMWVLFNEGWGQFDVQRVYEYARTLDNTRVYDTVSGWHDQGIGELRSWHVYFRKYTFKKDRHNRAVILSEFGGYSLKENGHTFNSKFFGYKRLNSSEELKIALFDLYRNEIMPSKSKGLAAAIYTELTDVEDELNGLITYDRKVIKIAPDEVKKIVSI